MTRSKKTDSPRSRRTAAAVAPVLAALRTTAEATGLHVGELLEAVASATERERAEWQRLDSLAFGFAYFPQDKDAFARQRARERGRDPKREVPRLWRELARRFPDAFAGALTLRGSTLRAHLEQRAPDVLRRIDR
jgi:hypothetical protein